MLLAWVTINKFDACLWHIACLRQILYNTIIHTNNIYFLINNWCFTTHQLIFTYFSIDESFCENCTFFILQLIFRNNLQQIIKHNHLGFKEQIIIIINQFVINIGIIIIYIHSFTITLSLNLYILLASLFFSNA